MALKNSNKTIDFVKNDGVIKELVANEEKARSKYESKWKFINELDKYCVEIAREKGFTEEEYRRMTIKHKGRKVVAAVTDVSTTTTTSAITITGSTSANTTSTTTTSSCRNVWKPAAERSRPVPCTTTGEIGWRSGDRYNLELFGRTYISPKLTINPPDMPDKSIYNIYLG